MIALLLVVLAALIVIIAGVRHHRIVDVASLGVVLVGALLACRWFLRDLHAHPANFLSPSA